MPEALYELHAVTKEYDNRRVLDVEALTVRAGEILALVGPSGAGKGTLLRLLNFLETPTAGRIVFEGEPYQKERLPSIDVRRRITTVFQRPMLLSRSVRANINYGLRVRGAPDADGAVDRVLKEVGLEALSGQDANRLSGGEAQRVALARAMVLRPDVLLMDEPTANLDPHNIAQIETIVRRLNEAEATTIVLVTHNIFQARRLAHRVALLLNGELIEVAESPAFFEDPVDPRTVAFVAGDLIY